MRRRGPSHLSTHLSAIGPSAPPCLTHLQVIYHQLYSQSSSTSAVSRCAAEPRANVTLRTLGFLPAGASVVGESGPALALRLRLIIKRCHCSALIYKVSIATVCVVTRHAALQRSMTHDSPSRNAVLFQPARWLHLSLSHCGVNAGCLSVTLKCNSTYLTVFLRFSIRCW